jgi:hypothetical protein
LVYQQIIYPEAASVFEDNQIVEAKYLRAKFKPWRECPHTFLSNRWNDLDNVDFRSEMYEIFLVLKKGPAETKLQLQKEVQILIENVNYNLSLFDSNEGSFFRQCESNMNPSSNLAEVLQNLPNYRLALTSKWLGREWVGNYKLDSFEPVGIVQAANEQQVQIIRVLKEILDDLKYNLDLIHASFSCC